MTHLQEALAAVLAQHVDFPPGAFVTLLKTKMTRNGKYASALLSVMPASMEKDVLQVLNDEIHVIKDELAHSLRMRRIPSIHWAFDETEHEAAKIEGIIHELKKKGEL